MPRKVIWQLFSILWGMDCGYQSCSSRMERRLPHSQMHYIQNLSEACMTPNKRCQEPSGLGDWDMIMTFPKRPLHSRTQEFWLTLVDSVWRLTGGYLWKIWYYASFNVHGDGHINVYCEWIYIYIYYKCLSFNWSLQRLYVTTQSFFRHKHPT